LHPTDPTQNRIAISFSSATAQEEVDTWRQLYNIDERYNDKCCSPYAKYWMQQVDNESQNYGVAPQTALINQIENRKKYPLQHCNFLRVPFLRDAKKAASCKQVHGIYRETKSSVDPRYLFSKRWKLPDACRIIATST